MHRLDTTQLTMRILACLLFSIVAADFSATAATTPEAEFFEKNIEPLLLEQCSSCHGDKVPIVRTKG